MGASIAILLIAGSAGTMIWVRNGVRERLRERRWAMFILLIGTVYFIGHTLHLSVPNPANWIAFAFSPIYKPIISWIEKGK